jgi:hypothetical protein
MRACGHEGVVHGADAALRGLVDDAVRALVGNQAQVVEEVLAGPAAAGDAVHALGGVQRLDVEEALPDGVEEALVEVLEGAAPDHDGARPLLLQVRVLVDKRHELVGQHHKRRVADLEGFQPALDGAARHGGALERVLRPRGQQGPLRDAADVVAASSEALHEPCHTAGTGDLDDVVDGADVDAQLEARRGHQGAQAAVAERLLGLLAVLGGKAAVVQPHEDRLACLVVQEAAAASQQFRTVTRVLEHQDAFVLLGEAADLTHLRDDAGGEAQLGGKLLVAGCCARLVDLQADLLHGVHDEDGHRPRSGFVLARHPVCHAFGVRDGGGKPDALEPSSRACVGLGRALAFRRLRLPQRFVLRDDLLDAFEGQHELRAPLRVGKVVDFVEDGKAHRGKVLAQCVPVEQQLQRLRRRDEDVRRLARLT